MMLRRILYGLAVLGASLARPGNPSAGLNPLATAQMYWQAGGGPGQPSRFSSDPTPQLVVTLKGVSNFRGVDVQLLVYSMSGSSVPPAWQGQAGGCNDSGVHFYIGGVGGAYENIFSTAPAVPSQVTSQNEEVFDPGDCKAPPGMALLWLCTAGAAGVPRDPSTEYAVWAIRFDLRGRAGGGPTDCEGDVRHSPAGICVLPNFAVPCVGARRGQVLAVLDGNLQIDYPPFASGFSALEWWQMCNCTPTGCHSPLTLGTWGRLQRLCM